jgi:hypothetical protein
MFGEFSKSGLDKAKEKKKCSSISSSQTLTHTAAIAFKNGCSNLYINS